MGFWNKLGKIVLTAAPYVAAPFTGGASLMATGLANKAVQKWSASDANKAVAKGLAPSKFDSVLGKVGGIAGMASSFIPGGQLGALTGGAKAASTAVKAADTASKVGKAAKIGQAALNIGKGALTGGGTGWQGQLGSYLGGQAQNAVMNRIGGQNDQPQYNPSMQQGGMAVPRTGGIGPSMSGGLGDFINMGRQEAIKNQPFRKGYDVTTRIGEPDEEGKYETRVTKMPKITSLGTGGMKKKKQQKSMQASY